MEETIQELSAPVETTTASTGISTVQGVMWGREILDAAKLKMFFEQFASIIDVPQGFRDYEMPIASTNLDFTLELDEATDRTMTEITNLNTVTFTPTSRKLGVAVSRDVIRTSQVDILRFAREQMVYDAARNVDTDLATAITAATGATDLFGGAATSEATLVAGDVLTTDLIAEGQSVLKQVGWMPEPDRPFVLFISAISEEVLLKDSQFVNAAEYGDQSVIMNGEIGRYLGVRVIVSEFVESFADGGAGGNLDGHRVLLLKAMVSYGLAWGERPFLDSEYWKLGAESRLSLDMTYDAEPLPENAIVIIRVLDA